MKALPLILACLMLAACFTHPVQQGSVIKPEALAQIHVGDSRYYVERMLGTPVLKDVLHPRRATYIEDHADPGNDQVYRHTVIIEYNSSDEVVEIRRTGFDEGKKGG